MRQITGPGINITKVAAKCQQPSRVAAVFVRCNHRKRCAKPPDRKARDHIVDHGHVFKQTGCLIGARNATACGKVGGASGDILITDAHRPFGRFVKAADDVQKGGFPRPVWTNDRCYLPRFGGKGNAVDGLYPAKGNGHIIDNQAVGFWVCFEPGFNIGGGNGLDTAFGNRDEAFNNANQPARCNQKHHNQKGTENQQAIFGKIRQEFWQQNRNRCPDKRPQHRARTAQNDGEKIEDRLADREVRRCDKHHQRCVQRTCQTGHGSRNGKARCLDRKGVIAK